MNALLWIISFIPSLIIEWVCWLTNPFACLFVYRAPRYDWVKRFGKYSTLNREYLRKPFHLWATHDNAVDEGWYGLYEIPFLQDVSHERYLESPIIRYWCRLWWLSRNTAYGWHYWLFSRPKETACRVYTRGVEGKGFWYLLLIYKSSFQFECHFPIGFWRYISINIGWKAHKRMPRLLYANRVIGLRKYK